MKLMHPRPEGRLCINYSEPGQLAVLSQSI